MLPENFDLIVAEAKSKYGEVHMVEVEDDVFLFRCLTRKEYMDTLMVTQDPSVQEEIICQLAVIYPPNLNFAQMGAGFASLLAPEIINQSGFGNLRKSHYYFDTYKERMMGSFEMQAEAAIQAAFPNITEEEMQNWTVEKLMRMLAKAEWILREVKGYPIEFQDLSQQTEGEAEEPKEPPTFKELGRAMREKGLDPMIEYAPYIVKPTKPFAEFPFIAGIEYWKRVF
jgi:hypothetical protein